MKFKACLYQEVYTTISVEAENEEEAKEKIMLGEFEETDDVTVKESEILTVEEDKE